MFVSVCYRLQHEPAASKWRGCRYRSQRHDRTGVRIRRHERDESPHRVASEYDVTRTSGRTLNNDVYTVWLQLEVGFVTLPSERSSTSRRTPSAAASCASTSTASKTATTSGLLSSNTALSSWCFSSKFSGIFQASNVEPSRQHDAGQLRGTQWRSEPSQSGRLGRRAAVTN